MARFCPSGSFERMDYRVLFFTRADTQLTLTRTPFPQRNEMSPGNSFNGASSPEILMRQACSDGTQLFAIEPQWKLQRFEYPVLRTLSSVLQALTPDC